jgi:hypothetical protein
MNKIFFILIGIFNFQLNAFSQIEITNQTTFHDATYGVYGALEDVSVEDNGGILYVFVKNNSNQKDSVVSLKISQNNITATLDGWRVWPYEMQPANSGNNVSTITAKSISSPVNENSPITIEVTTARGETATQNYFCITPKIRLANVIPSQDMRTLYIYLRNDDANNSFNINEVLINEKSYTAGNANELSVVGNNYTLTPGKIAILKLTATQPYTVVEPLAIRVGATRVGDNASVFVGAGIRVVPSEFFIGTWFSSGLNSDKIDTRIKNRRLRLSNTHGIGNYNLMDTAYQQFFIKVIRESNFGSPFDIAPAIADVQQNNNSPYIRYWTLDDEPDLSNKPINEQMEKNRVYWENDPNTPSYVNLAVEKKYSRYGWLPDAVCMDHYAAPDAPNIIPLTWTPVIGRKGEMKEALEYSEYLKFNTEPRRMYSWCQFQASTWGNDTLEQPRDYALNYQFWAHLAGGAKGIDFFVVQDKDETLIPEQYNEAIKLTRQSAAISGLISYSEYTDKVNVVATPANKATARALIGEEAMAMIALNDAYTFTASGALWKTAIDSVDYYLEIDIPAWLQTAQAGNTEIYQLLPDGSKGFSGFSVEYLNETKLKITPNAAIYKQSHVFVLAKKDLLAPSAVSGLNIPKQVDDYNYTLSWKEPFDNFGTLGYILKYNDAVVDTVYAPIYNVDSSRYYFTCAGEWKVYPFDNSWNIGGADSLEYFPTTPVAETQADITSTYADFSLVEGNDTLFTVLATNATDYDWQTSSDNINWQSINNGLPYFYGNGTSQLGFNDVPLTFNNNYFRVIARSWCAAPDTSTFFKITVLPNGIAAQENNFTFQIMPNPNQGVFNIRIQNLKQDASIIITDILGSIIKTNTYKNIQETAPQSIDISKEPSGIYILQVKAGSKTQSYRLVKY